jgi:ABC-type multidrug transport system permease subunit
MAMAMFRLMGAVLKSMVVANTFGMFVILIIFIFGGFLIPRGKHSVLAISFISSYLGTISQLYAHLHR